MELVAVVQALRQISNDRIVRISTDSSLGKMGIKDWSFMWKWNGLRMENRWQVSTVSL
jgi:ribonuclease HI